MGKNKEYSAGNGKKWAIFFAIVVLVAIVVVVVILAIPPNTYNAVETLNRTATTSYLTVNSEKESYQAFKEKMGKNTVVSAYQQELANIEVLSGSIDIILDFHNEYLVFAKDNKNLKNNYKAIKEGLEKSKESQKKLVKLVNKINKLSETSSTYLKGAMVDFREEFVDYLKSCKRAIGGLENAYSGSLGKVTFNNPASTLILNVVNDYMTVLLKDFKDLEKLDTKSYTMDNYVLAYTDLGLAGKIQNFHKFVSDNLAVELNEEIHDYYFNSEIREKYENLNEFYKLYSEKNTVNIISSMNQVGNITKKYTGVIDKDQAFENICKFIKGEL